MRAPCRSIAVFAVVLASGAPAPAVARRVPGLCAAAADATGAPAVVIVSAFLAEAEPIVAAMTVEETLRSGDREWVVGRLAGVRVVVGLLGIGMRNARTRAESVLARFDVAAVLVTGVAGSSARIGDVVVADDWVARDASRVYRANAVLTALVPRPGAASLERCTPVPPTSPDATIVCLPFDPAVVVGGHGTSGDDFGGAAFACVPGGGEILGCELPVVGALRAAAAEPVTHVVDMETAAVARVAAAAGVPFLGIRAVSDGAGDPLGDRGFPAQFFDYYRLAARNAATVTQAVVRGIAGLRGDRRTCRLLARRRWARAATRIAAAVERGQRR